MQSQSYQQIKKRLARAAKLNRRPLLGHFELTARCNLDCKMCYVHTQDHAAALRRELTTEHWKRIFDEAYECDMLYATLSGGECLLRKDFKELYLHLWNKRVMITVMSNGTLINDDYVKFFKEYPPEMVQISVYGSCEENYLNLTGRMGFEKTINAVSALENAGIDVRVVVTPSKFMLDDYIDILQFCKSKGFRMTLPDIMLMPNRENSEKNDYLLSDEEAFALTKQRAELFEELIPLECTPEPFGGMSEGMRSGLTCNAGNCLAAITWDGKMYPCLNILVGDGASLLDMSYAQAWEETKKAADSVVQGIECVGCAYEKICPECPSFRLNDLHNGHCNPAVCKMTRRLVAAGIKKLD